MKNLITFLLSISLYVAYDLFDVQSLDTGISSYRSVASSTSKTEIGKILGNMGRSVLFGKGTDIDLPRAFTYLSIAAKLGDLESVYYLYMMKNFSLDPFTYFNFRKVNLKMLNADTELNSKVCNKPAICTKSIGLKILRSLTMSVVNQNRLDRLVLKLIVRERIKTMTGSMYNAAAKNNIKANLYFGNVFYDVI